MMKRRKWLISLVVLGVIMGFSVPKPKAGINGDVSLDSLAVRDTVALPPLSYSMKVGKDTLILPDSSKAWNNFSMNWIRCVQGKIRLSRSSSWGIRISKLDI